HPCQAPAADFDQHHRAVRHRHRTLRKLETGGENADVGHQILRASLTAGGFEFRARNDFVASSMANPISLAKQSQARRLRKAAPRRQRRGNRNLLTFSPPPSTSRRPLVPDGHPYFEATIARERVEVLIIALEARRVGRL